MASLFISDLHLHESRPQITRAFFQFLHTQAATANALYILGDFFDAWIGDDDDAPLNLEVANELKKLSDAGTKIFLMHGNRDFLLGETFAAQAGAQLLPEYTTIDLYGEPTLLVHGDSLCTDDTQYIAFRQQVRSALWQQQILAQPLAARRALAAQLREKSQAMNSLKAEDIMDVNQAEVVHAMQNASVKRMIHGHTHRPAHHSFDITGEPAERIVLGDWHHKGWAIYADEHKVELISWPI
ncbi:UDP-2,3-diacylglucosamine hydrolase [Cellvibrio zantedeschiae]|uniref:UDP-2,3-diacylglucosamine hydrolase n=1 Tax=Cellvibrio zantedeschiae TaxID=1237077 RepID=A0ABQ3AZX7_9GAMM|nr:UDP-2,3-diacylglucosamine diphosphatase [Cellvibrio zantedeschiae]GGY69460.1 UDP-2,3-diacylglucosamine hydrolase [Cellvibrio zantedeschiae]